MMTTIDILVVVRIAQCRCGIRPIIGKLSSLSAGKGVWAVLSNEGPYAISLYMLQR